MDSGYKITPIAIVGIGCRLPAGTRSTDDLWQLVSQGRNAWSDVPSSRFDERGFHHPDPNHNGTSIHRGGHFLDEDISAFDAQFFGISRAESESMDPQQRLLLETTYEALENAGIPLEQIRGSPTAVFAATFARDYDRNLFKDPSNLPKYHLTGTGDAIVSNRISYMYDLRGPSMSIDTGCSGSMVCLHQACLSLRAGESTMAIVCGSNLILSPDHMLTMSMLHLLNNDGRSHPFDSRGNGYGRGEGITALVLKRLDDAVAAGDPIRAVIRNTGVNSDGRTSGITLPNPEAQERLQRTVYAAAGLDPRQTQYVEAHGTGTKTGDTFELGAIANVFSAKQSRDSPLFVGSIKSNIGHIEGSSGLAGVVNATLALEKGLIPPVADLQILKKYLAVESRNIRLPRQLESWPDVGWPRRASVNSFGYGGTNAHVILEAFGKTSTNVQTNGSIEPDPNSATEHQITHSIGDDGNAGSDIPYILPITARSEKSLQAAIEKLQTWAGKYSTTDLRDLSYTLTARRSHMLWRRSYVASSLDGFRTDLSQQSRTTRSMLDVRLCFVFTGQGAQWYAMGRELLFTRSRSRFTDSLIKSERILKDLGAPWSLITELLATEGASRLQKSELSQPICTALQVALVDLLQSFGIEPQVVIGHSSGEIAAAYAAGYLSHEAALTVAFHRSFMASAWKQQSKSKGAMLVVGLGATEARTYLAKIRKGQAVVACVNSPSSTTLSGDESAILELQQILKCSSVFNRKLNVDVAYHSHHMQAVADIYLRRMKELPVEGGNMRVEFISSVSGAPKESGFDASYWVQNLVSEVRYSDAVSEFVRSQHAQSSSTARQTHAIIEVGPHATLEGPTRQTIASLALQSFDYQYVPTLIRRQNAAHTILKLVGKLFEIGAHTDLDAANSISESDTPTQVINSLPPYSWDHSTSYWHESRLSEDYRRRLHPPHELLGVRVPGSTMLEPSWHNTLSTETSPWLQDHVIDGAIVFPGAAYLCMALEAVRQWNIDRKERGDYAVEGDFNFVLRDIVFEKALIVPPSPRKVELYLTMRSTRAEAGDQELVQDFYVSSMLEKGRWHEHCHGQIFTESTEEERSPSLADINHHKSFNETGGNTSNKAYDYTLKGSKDIYDLMNSNGNFYGPAFATLTELSVGHSQAIGQLRASDIKGVLSNGLRAPYVIHPATLDSMLQIAVPLYAKMCPPGPVMPVSLDELTITAGVLAEPGTRFDINATGVCLNARSITANIAIYQETRPPQKESVITFSGLEVQGIGDKPQSGSSTDISPAYEITWKPDVDHLPYDALPSNPSSTTEIDKLTSWNLAASHYIAETLKELRADTSFAPDGHLKLFFEWMARYLDSKSKVETSHQNIEPILEKVKRLGVEGEMLTRIGRNLSSILRGQVEALSVMLEDDLLYRMYAEDSSSRRCYSHLAEYVKLLSFKNPNMSVLEIGAGTASATVPLLEAFNQTDGRFLKDFTFTDVSAGFFEHAKTLLDQWGSVINYKTLDLERDPLKQGFAEASYDLVVAANVVHAISSIDTALMRIRKLLKPGGRLVLIELTRLTPYVNTIFGTLPGWWAGSGEGRRDSPLLTKEMWNIALTRASFNGVELAADDITGTAQRATLMVSRANGSVSQTSFAVRMLTETSSKEMLQRLTETLQHRQIDCESIVWHSLDTLDDAIYIIVDDKSDPLLGKSDTEKFSCLRRLLSSSSRVLWLSLSRNDAKAGLVDGLTTGFTRSARAENEALELVTIDVKQDFFSILPNLSHAIASLCSMFSARHESRHNTDYEYEFIDGRLRIPRITQHSCVKTWMHQSLGDPQMELQPFHQSGRPLKLHSDGSGVLGRLCFVDDDDTVSAPLGYDEIEVEVRACTVNPKDASIILGRGKPSFRGAYQCAGIVTAVGLGLGDRVSVGDRVCAFAATSPYANLARADGKSIYLLPQGLPFSMGASLPFSLSIAHQALIKVAGLQAEQSVLVLSSSTSLGKAAIKVAQSFGARIYASAGDQLTRDLLKSTYKIPDNQILPTSARIIRRTIGKLTLAHGVNAVFDPIAQFSNDIWKCVSANGAYIEIPGAHSKRPNMSMEPFERGVRFISFDLYKHARDHPMEFSKGLENAMSLLKSQPPQQIESSAATMPLSSIAEALTTILTNEKTGEIVLEADEHTTVKVLRSSILKLDEGSTYLIAGGLGDLGRRICGHLIDLGARHLAVLSRNVRSPEVRQDLENELKSSAKDVNLRIVECDISSQSTVEAFLSDHCKKDFPPIKGVIQAAMVLQDTVIENMSMTDFELPLRPKIHGTRNLSNALADNDLDFFVMLSSCASVLGNRAQANYAAGCSFQDAFAHRQADHRTHYISLNLGSIEGSSITANHQENMDNLIRQGYSTVKIEEFFALLDYAMSDDARNNGCHQAIIGFDGASLSAAKGTSAATVNPMFNRLLSATSASESISTGFEQTSSSQQLSLASSRQEAVDTIIAVMTRKLSSLTAIDIEEIEPTRPITALGLDSLVTIELRNWINRELHTTVQNHEILDTGSLIVLANIICDRSSLVSSTLAESTAVGESTATSSNLASRLSNTESFTAVEAPIATPPLQSEPQLHEETIFQIPSGHFDVATDDGFQRKLSTDSNLDTPVASEAEVEDFIKIPIQNALTVENLMPPQSIQVDNSHPPCSAAKLPLPSLDETFRLYLESISSFCSEAELEEAAQLVRDFKTPGGLGQKLQYRLIARFNDPTCDSWIEDLYNASNFLGRRYPVYPYDVFFGTHPLTEVPHSQAERAAIITQTAFEFQKALEEQRINADKLNEKSLCMDSLSWMFNTVRIPCQGTDQMGRYPGNSHIAVLSRGHVYRVELEEEGGRVSFDKLVQIFHAIWAASTGGAQSIGGLGADERNSWAMVRSVVVSANQANMDLFDMVDTASFVICLDEASPTTSLERTNQFLLGDLGNRWPDKSLQFIICRNGVSAHLVEHTMVDGTTVKQLIERIHAAIRCYEPRPTATITNLGPPPTLQEQRPFITPDIASHLRRVHQQFQTNIAPVEPCPFLFEAYGAAFFRSHRIAPKTGFLLLILLANRMHFGYTPAVWEVIGLRHFHKGRVSITQVILPAVFAFIQSATDKTSSLNSQKKLFVEAARAHQQMLFRASKNCGIDRHLDALLQVLEEGEDPPGLYKSSAYTKTRPSKMMTDCTETGCPEVGFVLRDEGALWMHYEVEEQICRFSVIGDKGQTESYRKLISQAGEIVKRIFESK